MPNCHELASKFLTKRATRNGVRTLHSYGGELWEWNDHCYKSLGPKDMRRRVLYWLRSQFDEFSRSTWEWVCDNVDATLGVEAPGSPPCWLSPENEAERDHAWISMRNGILDLSDIAAGRSASLISADPRWFSTNVLPVDYDGGAKCPQWERCIEAWTCGDAEIASFLQEYTGYLLTPEVRHHVGLFLEGEGSNGKGILCETIRMLLGNDNCSAVPLEHWGQTFALSDTLNKLVNFCTDTGNRKELPGNAMKRYVSSDTYTFQRKYLGGITRNPTARLIVSWNRRPEITDDSDGFWRRMMLVPFRKQFSIEERDEYLLDKLGGELSGILNWAIAGYCRLHRRGKFSRSGLMAATAGSYREESDPARAFLLEHVAADAAGCIEKAAMYKEFTEWCAEKALAVRSASGFSKTLYRLYTGAGSKRSGGLDRTWVYTGVRWVNGRAPSC